MAKPSLRGAQRRSNPPRREHKAGLLRFARNDVEAAVSTLATRIRPSCATSLPSLDQRAQGKPGADRTRSLACNTEEHTSVFTTGTTEQPGFPRAMVLRFPSCSPRGSGLSCPRDRTESSAQLDARVAAPGPHDFAVRCRRFRPREVSPALTPQRPSQPAPTFRDDRVASPLVGAG
jgi:hypothetical protein